MTILHKLKNLCQPGSWPAHAWYVGYAPYDDPEIAVIAFVYHGTEGSTVSAPIVREVIKAYFNLKAIDNRQTTRTIKELNCMDQKVSVKGVDDKLSYYP